jgi:hypothetical protein
MPTSHPAPTVTAAIAGTVLLSPTAVAVLDLITGKVSLVARPDDEVWEDATVLVLITHADAVAAAAIAAGRADFRQGLVDVLNADLAALHAAGEIPTAQEVADVLAELDQFEAEVIDLFAGRVAG